MALNILKNRVFWYYFFLLAGGLWNYLGFFEDIMSATSGYVMILLGIVTLLESRPKVSLLLFSIITIIGTIILEYIGVKSGLLFGSYYYTNMLQPQVYGIPLAIGFSWLTLTLISINISKKITTSKIISSIIGASILTIIDVILEPAAIKIGYWVWDGETPPLLNYITWFAIGFLLFQLSNIMKIDIKNWRLKHILFAQLIFFILSQI